MPTNITLTSKYVEDASGNKFAPITTPNAVRFSDGDTLTDKLIQSDWNQSSSSAIDYIKNKPSSLPANGGNAATVNNHTVLSDVPANAVFTDTTYSVMGASGSSHASGLVPDPGSTAGTTKFLREDGTWQIPENGSSVIPVVLLYEPSTPELGMVMFDASETNKFYQYFRGSWVEVSTPHKAIGVGNNDYMYEIIDGVLSQTPIADLEYNTWYIYYTGGPRYQIGQVVFIDEYNGGGILSTYMEVDYWNNKQDAITFNSTYDATTNPAATMADVSGKEDKMSIVQMMNEPISTLSPAINTLYTMQASTLDVTLPTITDTTKVQSFVMMPYFSSSNPSITIHGTQDNICVVYMPTDISLEEGKAYEINCMFLGRITTQPPGDQSMTFNNWSVAIRDIGEANLG